MMADVKNQSMQPSPVSVTYSMGSIPNPNQQQQGMQPSDQAQQQQMQQQNLQQSIQVQQQSQTPQFVFQQPSVSVQTQLGNTGTNAITTMANIGTMGAGGINMANLGLQHTIGGQSGQSVQHSNISSTPMPQLQVIQQPMAGGSYIQQLYNTQGQPILMPGSVLQHGVNQPIQVIAAGKPFQGGQIAGSHMIAGKQIVQTGQAVGDWSQFRNATYIPTSGQGQTLVISQLGQLGTVLNSSQSNIITTNQNAGKPGEQKQQPYLHVVNSINQKTPILPVSVSNGVGVSVGVPTQIKNVNQGGATGMTSQSQIMTTQAQSTMMTGQTQLISPLQYVPQQFNLGQGFTWATGPNGMQQPILSHNPPIYIRSGTQPDGSGGMIFAAPAQQQIQTHQQAAITQIGQIGVSPPVRNRQPGEVSVGPPIQPKVAPRPISTAPPQIRPAPASSVSTQTAPGQNSGTIKSKVRKMAAQKAAQQSAAKQNIENAVRAGLIPLTGTPIMSQQGQLQFVSQQGQIQQYQVQQPLQGSMVQFNPQMPMQFQIVGAAQTQTVSSQAQTQMTPQIVMQTQVQPSPNPQPMNQPVQSTTHHPSPGKPMSPHPSQSPRPYSAHVASSPHPSPHSVAQSPVAQSPSVAQSPYPVAQSPHSALQSQQQHMQSPVLQQQMAQNVQTASMPQLMSPPILSPRPVQAPQTPMARQVTPPPAPSSQTPTAETPRPAPVAGNGVLEPTAEPEPVAPSPLQQIQMQVQQQFSSMPTNSQTMTTVSTTRLTLTTASLLPTTTTTAPSQMIAPSVSFGPSTVTVPSRSYRPIAPAPVPGSQPMTAVPFGNLPPAVPPITFPPPVQEVPSLIPQISVPSMPQLTLPYGASVQSSISSSMVTIPSSALIGAPVSVSSPMLTMPSLDPVPMDVSPEKKSSGLLSPRKVVPKVPEQRDANQNVSLTKVETIVPDVKEEPLTGTPGKLEPFNRATSPASQEDTKPESPKRNPSILTHVIGDFLIQESSEPFPVVRLFPPSPGKKAKQRSEDGPPRKKMALDGEMATCERCGTVDFASKFKKNKTYCSSACVKKANQMKAGPLPTPPTHDSQPINPLTNGITPLNPIISPSTPTHPPVISVPGNSPLKAPEEMSDKDLDAELVMLAAQQNIQVVEGRLSPPPIKNDPCRWTARDVAEFVRTLPGCDEYADEFLIQEIDGQALMLLKADHLMSAMNMKLGPALKICAKIESMRAEANR